MSAAMGPPIALLGCLFLTSMCLKTKKSCASGPKAEVYFLAMYIHYMFKMTNVAIRKLRLGNNNEQRKAEKKKKSPYISNFKFSASELKTWLYMIPMECKHGVDSGIYKRT